MGSQPSIFTLRVSMIHLALSFILLGLCLSNAQDAPTPTQPSQQNQAQGQSHQGGYPFPHEPYYGYSAAGPPQPYYGYYAAATPLRPQPQVQPPSGGAVPNPYAPAPVATAGGMGGNEMFLMMMMMQQNQMEQQMLLPMMLMMNGGMGGAGGMGGNNMMLFYLMMMMNDDKADSNDSSK